MAQSLLAGKIRLVGDLRLPWLLLLIVVAVMIAIAPLPVNTAVSTTRHIHITAGDFGFTPGIIRVNSGDRVTLELTSADVVHGLYLDKYDVSITAEPGQPASLTFVANQTGTFRFRCSVTCGALHPFMMGKLQVGTNWLFWRVLALAIVVVLFCLVFIVGRQKAANNEHS